jgi:hypothetical protein
MDEPRELLQLQCTTDELFHLTTYVHKSSVRHVITQMLSADVDIKYTSEYRLGWNRLGPRDRGSEFSTMKFLSNMSSGKLTGCRGLIA